MSTKKTTKTATKKAAPQKETTIQTIPVVETPAVETPVAQEFTPVVSEIAKVKAVPAKKEHIAIRQEVYNLVTSVAGPRKGQTIGAFVEGLINKHFEGAAVNAESHVVS